MTSRSTGGTYGRIAELPVVIDGYALESLSRRVSSGFRRFTTVFGLAGAGHEGLGEDVTYEAAEHRQAATGRSGAAARGRLDGRELLPAARPAGHLPGAAARAAEVSRTYRRWALESAALDLALRQAGQPLHAVLGRTPSAGAIRGLAEPRPGSELRAVAEPAGGVLGGALQARCHLGVGG